MAEGKDNLKKLYEAVGKEYSLPAYDVFVSDMQDTNNRRKLYDAVSADYSLPDYDKFQLDMGFSTQEPPLEKTPIQQAVPALGQIGAQQIPEEIPSPFPQRAKAPVEDIAYSFDEIQPQEEQTLPAVSTFGASTEGRPQANLPKTVKEIRAEGGKPTFSNYLASVGEGSAEHIGEFLEEGFIGVKEGVKKASQGLKMMQVITPTYEETVDITNKYPDNIALRGYAKFLSGVGHGGISLLMHTTGGGIAIGEGIKLGEKIISETTTPETAEQVGQWLFAPVTTVWTKANGEELGDTESDVASVLDIAAFMGALGLAKGGHSKIKEKWDKGLKLTPEEMNVAVKSSMEVMKDPDLIKQVEDVKGVKLRSDEGIKKKVEEMEENLPENKVVSIVENKKKGKVIIEDIVALDVPKEKYQKIVGAARDVGEITTAQQSEMLADFDRVQRAKKKTPETYRSNPKVIERMIEKERLEKQKKDSDDSFHPFIDEEIVKVKEEIAQAIREPSVTIEATKKTAEGIPIVEKKKVSPELEAKKKAFKEAKKPIDEALDDVATEKVEKVPAKEEIAKPKIEEELVSPMKEEVAPKVDLEEFEVETEQGMFNKKEGKWFDENGEVVADKESIDILEESIKDIKDEGATQEAETPTEVIEEGVDVFEGKTDKQIKRINKVVDLMMEDPSHKTLQGAGTKAFIKKHKKAIDAEIARIKKEEQELDQTISKVRKKKGEASEQGVTTEEVKTEAEFLDESGRPITPSAAEIKREERIMKSKDRAQQEASLNKLVKSGDMTPEQMELAMAKYDKALEETGTKSEGRGAKQGETGRAPAKMKEESSAAVPESEFIKTSKTVEEGKESKEAVDAIQKILDAKKDNLSEVLEANKEAIDKFEEAKGLQFLARTGRVTGVKDALKRLADAGVITKEQWKQFAKQADANMSEKIKKRAKPTDKKEGKRIDDELDEGDEPISEKLNNVADFLEEQRRFDNDEYGAFASFVPLSPKYVKEMWNGTIDVAIKTIRAGAKVSKAIEDAIAHMRESDWYKRLTLSQKVFAEKSVAEHIESAVKEIMEERDFAESKAMLHKVVKEANEKAKDKGFIGRVNKARKEYTKSWNKVQELYTEIRGYKEKAKSPTLNLSKEDVASIVKRLEKEIAKEEAFMDAKVEEAWGRKVNQKERQLIGASLRSYADVYWDFKNLEEFKETLIDDWKDIQSGGFSLVEISKKDLEKIEKGEDFDIGGAVDKATPKEIKDIDKEISEEVARKSDEIPADWKGDAKKEELWAKWMSFKKRSKEKLVQIFIPKRIEDMSKLTKEQRQRQLESVAETLFETKERWWEAVKEETGKTEEEFLKERGTWDLDPDEMFSLSQKDGFKDIYELKTKLDQRMEDFTYLHDLTQAGEMGRGYKAQQKVLEYTEAVKNKLFPDLGEDIVRMGGSFKKEVEAVLDAAATIINKAIDAGYKGADLVKKVIEDLKGHELYKKLAGNKRFKQSEIENTIAELAKEREKLPPSLSELIRDAKKEGIESAKEFADFLEEPLTKEMEKAWKESEKTTPKDEPPPTKEVTKDAKGDVAKMFSDQRKEIEDYKKNSKTLLDKISKAFIDRSGRIKDKLMKTDPVSGSKAIQEFELRAGAQAGTALEYTEAVKEIYGDLFGKIKGKEGIMKESEQKLLADYIQAKRTIEIDRIADSKGEARPESPNKLHREELEQWIEAIKNNDPALLKEYGMDAFDVAKLDKKVKIYTDVLKGKLKEMLDGGLITKASYNELKDLMYSPRLFIQHLDPLTNIATSKGSSSVPNSGIKELGKGSEQALVNNPQTLLLNAISRANGRIAKNKANQALAKFVKANPDNGFIEMAELTPEYKANPKGDPKFIDAPNKWISIDYMDKGVKKRMNVLEEFGEDWMDADPMISQATGEWLSHLSGASTTKFLATTANPVFAMGNFFRDAAHMYLTTEQYSPIAPVFAAQLARDMAKVHNDVVMRKGVVKDYIKEGGGMELLSQQAVPHLKIGKHNPLRESVNFLTDALGYIGTTSELMTRLAIRERTMRNLTKEYKDEGVEITPEIQKEIQREATWVARNYIDFSQGGTVAKGVDKIVPYFNAGLQGTRGTFRAAKRNPKLFSVKAAQIGAFTLGVTAWNLLDPERRRYYNDEISSDEKARNYILMTPFWQTDDKGQKRYLYLKFPKDQGQQLISGLFEDTMQETMYGKEGAIMNERRLQELEGLISAIPGTGSVPPVVRGMLAYKLNKRLYTQEDVYKGEPVLAKDEKNPYTPIPYVKAGEITGLSPMRMEAAIGEVIPQTSAIPQMFGMGLGAVMGGMSEAEKNEVNKTTFEQLTKLPFFNKVTGLTNPANKREATKKIKEEENSIKAQHNYDLDVRALQFKAGKIKEDDVEKWIATMPEEEQDRLMQRFEDRKANVQVWYQDIKNAPAKAAARAWYVEWNKRDTKGRKEMDELAGEFGIYTSSFMNALGELEDKEGALDEVQHEELAK